jgi:hypothetical protein
VYTEGLAKNPSHTSAGSRIVARTGDAKKRLAQHLCTALALFAGNLLLLGPWLTLDFSDQPWNNGYIYIGIARLFRDHKWTWNQLQYGGAPFHYLYPPIFHVLVGLAPVASLGRAFHLVTAIGYALTPVCLYILGMQLFRSRILAAFAAIAYSAFPSITYAMPTWRALAQPYAYAPWGFVALVAYDEAAHAFALPVMLLAVAAAWRNRWILASVLASAVFLTNWPALIGLGFAIAGLAVARMRDLGVSGSLACAAGMVGSAYGLSAFWMTPGYFVSSTLLNRIVLRHTLFSAPWSGTSWMILLAALALVGLSFWRRVPAEIALTGIWVALAGLVVVSYTIAGNYLLPSPHRYMLELNAGLVLMVTGLLSLVPGKWRAIVTLALVVAGASVSYRFLMDPWKLEPHPDDPHAGVAYRVAAWLGQHAEGSRVFASGELDSTLNLWSDVAQVGGTGQDISNFLIFAAERQVAFGCRTDSERIAELWLRALNVPLLLVHHAESREYFHWYSQPEKFAALPLAWDDGEGDTIYRVPNFERSDAVVVDLASLPRLPPLVSTADERFLEAYVKWAAGKRSVAMQWSSADEAEFDVNLDAGEAVLVKVNDDPGWSTSGASMESDPIGFQLIRAGPKQQHFTLRFGPSWDAWLGRAITLLTIALLVVRVRGAWICLVAVVPAVVAWAVLMAGAPRTASVAEKAFIRLQPPLINPRGIVDSATNQQPPLRRGSVTSVYGLNFGSSSDAVRIWVDGRSVDPVFHSPNLVNFRLPQDAPESVTVSVEVNGCRGNEFLVQAR